MKPPNPIFGIPERWEHFANSHALFLERRPRLEEAAKLAFTREDAISAPVDAVVFFIGRLCAEDFEDFMEILLLCGNGYGVGALKILRGMYERVVTAWYLHRHPEKAEAFLNFYWVERHRLVNAIKAVFGGDFLTNHGVPQAEIDKHEAKFHEVREQFIEPLCKKCNTNRLSGSWTRLDMVALAKKAGDVGQLIIQGYHLPTRQAHSTVVAVLERLQELEGGVDTFNGGPQYDKADEALLTAHMLMLYVFELQKEHFNLNALEEPLQKCVQDFQDIWGSAPPITTQLLIRGSVGTMARAINWARYDRLKAQGHSERSGAGQAWAGAAAERRAHHWLVGRRDPSARTRCRRSRSPCPALSVGAAGTICAPTWPNTSRSAVSIVRRSAMARCA